MKQNIKLNNIIILFFVFYSPISILAQCKINVTQKANVFSFKGVCNDSIIFFDSLVIIQPLKDYRYIERKEGDVYVSWTMNQSSGNTYYVRRYFINNKNSFEIGKAHWIKQDFFDKPLKENGYLELKPKGIKISFKNPSIQPILVNYNELNNALLQDILKERE